jgi:hypothetical protein
MDIQFLLDSNGEDLAVKHTQDVEPILEANKRLRDERQKSDWGRHVASIPNVIYMRWLQEEYDRGNVSLRPFTQEMDDIVAKKLKDPEWAYLRTDSNLVQGFMGFGS